MINHPSLLRNSVIETEKIEGFDNRKKFFSLLKEILDIKKPISNEHDHGFDKSKIKTKTELDEMFPVKKRD